MGKRKKAGSGSTTSDDRASGVQAPIPAVQVAYAAAPEAGVVVPVQHLKVPFSYEQLDAGFLAIFSLVIKNLVKEKDFSWRKLAEFLSSPANYIQASNDHGYAQLNNALLNPQGLVHFHNQHSFTVDDKKALRYLMLAFVVDMIMASGKLDTNPQWQAWKARYIEHLRNLYQQVPQAYKQELIIHRGDWKMFAKDIARFVIGVILPIIGCIYIIYTTISSIYQEYSNPAPNPRSYGEILRARRYISSALIKIMLALIVLPYVVSNLKQSKPTIIRIQQFQAGFDQKPDAIRRKYEEFSIHDAKVITQALKNSEPDAGFVSPEDIRIGLDDSLEFSKTLPQEPQPALAPDFS